MSINHDLIGLRNAVLVFPDVVRHYLDTRPTATKRSEAFDIVVRISDQVGLQYQTIIICQCRMHPTTGCEVTQIAAMGEEASEVYMALSSLLGAVADMVDGALIDSDKTKKLENRLRNTGGAKWVNPSLVYGRRT